jgi:D-alanine-D-alanine ligase
MHILVLVDPEELQHGEPWGKLAARPGDSEASHVASTLRALGHEVEVQPFGSDMRAALGRLAGSPAELVFNLTLGARGSPRGGADIAGALEVLRLPFTGTGSAGALVACDLGLSRRVVRGAGLATPRFLEVPPGQRPAALPFPFPVLVRPQLGGGRMESTQAVRARDPKEMGARIRWIHEHLRQPAICEEFIEGREISVGVLGDVRLTVLPTAAQQPLGRWRRVELPRLLRARLERLSREIHRELELSDYSRLDYRLTPDGQLFFLRAEHRPRLTPRSFGRFASWNSIGFPRLLQRLCELAWRRGPLRAISGGASLPRG